LKLSENSGYNCLPGKKLADFLPDKPKSMEYALMQVKDSQVIRIVESIGEHYRSNISSRYIRPALLHLPLDKIAWDAIEVLTEKLDQFRYQGFNLEELYQQIIAAARFISLARKELSPTLRNRIQATTSEGPDKVMWDMAVSNFNSNLQVFADLVNELFVRLVELDKAYSKGSKPPLFTQMPELSDIGQQLVGS
jgi:hypothetical protein